MAAINEVAKMLLQRVQEKLQPRLPIRFTQSDSALRLAQSQVLGFFVELDKAL
jgi:hypothetical protein